MIINHLNVFCTGRRPSEADPPLVIDPDAPLTESVTLKGFEAIARRYPQIFQPAGDL
ncbi:MAG: hypothetical protein JFAIHJKO_01596 [Pyrinomonadaceae bacterium]|nr:hypothetical protein [Pyrinomonadaceae bacterium]